MSDPVVTTKAAGKEKVEDLVKVALKEAMEKRRMAAATPASSVPSNS
jgi:DNA-binding protein YbaB